MLRTLPLGQCQSVRHEGVPVQLPGMRPVGRRPASSGGCVARVSGRVPYLFVPISVYSCPTSLRWCEDSLIYVACLSILQWKALCEPHSPNDVNGQIQVCWRQSVYSNSNQRNKWQTIYSFKFLCIFFLMQKPLINFFFLTLVSTAAFKDWSCYLFCIRKFKSISYCILDWSCSWRWMF